MKLAFLAAAAAALTLIYSAPSFAQGSLRDALPNQKNQPAPRASNPGATQPPQARKPAAPQPPQADKNKKNDKKRPG